MKQKTTTTTRSKSASHNGSANNDTNTSKKYRVSLFWSQFRRAVLEIEAESLNEAERMAEQLRAADVQNWKCYYERVSIESVEGGQDND